ncbi:MAG: glyoxylate/hydroxypyruvate reductase A [Rhizobiales bacterium]|nr:glyoxylate/hydroxypyruvate reductase A [Hyphomicrobiales bacterium]
MALLLTAIFGAPEEWRKLIAAEMPDVDVRIWPGTGDPADIEVAAVAGLPRGKLKSFPNLRLIVSLTAGIDMLLGDPDLPAVPIVRAADPDGDVMIDEFALLHVLRHHREMPAFALAQQKGEWLPIKPKHAHERPVGVMGLGAIGLSVAQTLARHGFDVAGWVRSPRQADGIAIFHGSEQLSAFLARSEIVINLLPLTPETKGILNAATFNQLPKGASVINLGRGPHVAEVDLMAALDSGHLAAATLDVFPIEPLPKDSSLWRHPKITITPHASRRIYPGNLAPRVCDAIRRLQSGAPLQHQVDRKRGY